MHKIIKFPIKQAISAITCSYCYSYSEDLAMLLVINVIFRAVQVLVAIQVH